MKNILKNSNTIAVLIIFLVTCLMFFKIFQSGLYPIPANLLVSFYFPWYSGGWEGYDPWTTHKELLSADAIRQIYLWKEFAMDQFKNGNIPLWNPFTFSGQPLLANFQSSSFYPLNIVYFLTNFKNAWIIFIISQPFLGGIFMYLLIQSFGKSKLASYFGAFAFMFSSYLVTWMENGNIAHSYIWLPLSFWAINRYFEKLKFRHLLILIFSLSLSILGGHPQTAIYIYMAASIFWLYKMYEYKIHLIRRLSNLIAVILVSLLLTSLQLLPTYDFYKSSPISLPFSSEVFERSILPYNNLVTFLAPDFFGHPATENFWNQSYGDFTPYFGVVPFIFAVWGIYSLRKDKFVKFASFTSALFILSAVNSPITWAIKTFRVPILDSTTPSRFVSISIFLMIIVSAFAIQDLLKNFENKKYKNKFLRFLLIFSAIYTSLWLFTIFGKLFLGSSDVWLTNLKVTQRNLILPTAMFITIPLGLISIEVIKKIFNINEIILKYLFMLGIFFTLLFGGLYFSNKFLPASPKKFIFPEHSVFNWLKENATLYRFYGGGTAHIDFNYPTHYEVYGAEGYDTLRYERYAQLLASGFDGKVPETYLRSDAVFANVENGYRKRLFELLGVRYLLDKEDNPKSDADWHYERFPNDKINGIWQQGKFQVYERENVLPRIFLTTNYYVAKSDKEIIEKIYNPEFDLTTILLEKEPPIKIEKKAEDIIEPEIIKYLPNEILVQTNSKTNSLLFISDSFDKDWKVKIDDKKSELFRAHYSLRSIAVPEGEHMVSLKYQPKSFTIGIWLTLTTTLGLLMYSIYSIKQRKF